MGRGARRPAGFRDVSGILLLDKPKGISSNQALQKIRYLFRANKAGHTGSLDPLATGMLPVCFGEATKFSAYLLDANKSYRATCQLGQTSTTGDAEGEITSLELVSVDQSEINSVLESFVGHIEQVPPMHSAIKVNGQRLYKLARTGREVKRDARTIEIHRLEQIAFNNNHLVIDVLCSKGTYIRTLAEDIGESLGCGAYLSDLRRSGVHPFWKQRCYSLHELEEMAESSIDLLDACLLPVQAALSDLPELKLDSTAADSLKMGRVIQPNSVMESGLLNLVTETGRFIGIGEAGVYGRISPKRLMNTAR